MQQALHHFDIRYMHMNQLKEVWRDRWLAAGDMPPAVPISQDRSFLLANPSVMWMVGPLSLLYSGWLSVVEFLVLNT